MFQSWVNRMRFVVIAKTTNTVLDFINTSKLDIYFFIPAFELSKESIREVFLIQLCIKWSKDNLFPIELWDVLWSDVDVGCILVL